MSLIGEALKRARLEAARREGEERGTAHSTMPAYLPARRRSRATWIAATLLAALTGAAAVYLLLRPAASTPPFSAHPPLLGKEDGGPGDDSMVEPAAVPTRSTPPPATPSPAASPSLAPPASAGSPQSTVKAPSVPSPVPTAAPAAPAAAAVPSTAGARVYVRVAELGGTRLELDGIVASETDPVAMINRKLLGIGEGLDGWVVEKIEAKQVTLRGGRETVVLKLR